MKLQSKIYSLLVSFKLYLKLKLIYALCNGSYHDHGCGICIGFKILDAYINFNFKYNLKLTNKE